MGYQNYILDSAIPKQYIQFNGIVDMPFGCGKRFLGGSNRFMDELVGGWQVAGDGNIRSQDFQPANGNWGPTNPLRIYKHMAKITDCRSGLCHQAFEWFTGYLFPTVTTDCTSKCVTGLPSGWAPYESPVNTTPTSKYYGTNDVQVALSNGTAATVAYSPGPQRANLYSHTLLNGSTNWTIDLSLFEVVPVTESANLRFDVDLNALNVQSYNGEYDQRHRGGRYKPRVHFNWE